MKVLNIGSNKQKIALYIGGSTVVKLGHMIVILSLSLVGAAILLLVMSGIHASDPFLNQNVLVANDIIKSKETRNSVVNIVDTGPTMYLIVKVDPSNIPLSAIVKDPDGSIESSSTFSQDLVANFKPDKIGKYSLILMNQGSIDVKFNSIIGYLPLFGENQGPNYEPLGAIFLAAFLLVLGCLGLAGGILISIKNLSSSGLFKNTYTFSRNAGKKIVSCFKPGAFRFRRSSTTIRRDLIAERLSELEKHRNELVLDGGFEKKHKLTEE